MSKNVKAGDIGEMGSIVDETGEVHLSVNDLIHHLETNMHRMNEVQPEHVTASRFIELLRSFETGIKKLYAE